MSNFVFKNVYGCGNLTDCSFMHGKVLVQLEISLRMLPFWFLCQGQNTVSDICVSCHLRSIWATGLELVQWGSGYSDLGDLEGGGASESRDFTSDLLCFFRFRNGSYWRLRIVTRGRLIRWRWEIINGATPCLSKEAKSEEESRQWRHGKPYPILTLPPEEPDWQVQEALA